MSRLGAYFVLFVEEIDLAKIALSCLLPLTYSATRKEVTILHNASLGTIARGKYLF